MNLAEKLKIFRKRANVTQQELADAIKVSIMTVRRWEWGDRTPRLEEIEKIAAALGTTVGILMGEIDPEAAPPETPQRNLPINNAPENENKIGLGYWGTVADNARKVAARGDPKEAALIAPLLRSALEAITNTEGNSASKTDGNFIGVQENHKHIGDNYVKGGG